MIQLSGLQRLYTFENNISYRVVSGTVFVYYCTVANNRISRVRKLLSLSANSVIPFMKYVSGEETAVMMITAETAAQVEKLAYCDDHAEAFLSLMGIRALADPELAFSYEVFCETLSDYVYFQAEKKGILISRHKEIRKNDRERATDRIALLFRTDYSSKLNEAADSDNRLYNAMSVLCRLSKIKIAPYKKVLEYAAGRCPLPT